MTPKRVNAKTLDWSRPENVAAAARALARRRAQAEAAATATDLDGTGWEEWLGTIAAGWVDGGFAGHHSEFWDTIWGIEPEVRPDPLVFLLARGHGKSVSVELATLALLCRRVRKYAVYLSATQDLADGHVDSLRSLFGLATVGQHYPAFGRPALDKYGNSRGWRRSRVTLEGGGIVDALGLDSAARGIKWEDERPGLIVMDDLDSHKDSLLTIAKKVETLTLEVIHAGAKDCAFVFAQNLSHPDGIAARMADGRATWFFNRKMIGPVPAVKGLEVTERETGGYVITGGEATWDGMPLSACQATIDDAGLSAFLRECQHDMTPPDGGMFDHVTWVRCQPSDVPQLVKTVVWLDPAVTSTDESDSQGIQCDGVDETGTIYRLYSCEERTSPQQALKKAYLVAAEYGASKVGVETDQGGDTWRSVVREVLQDEDVRAALGGRVPTFDWRKAGAGHGSKVHRSSQMLARGYETPGKIVHVVGTHAVLEGALGRFPRTKPFDLADVAYWSWLDCAGYSGPPPKLVPSRQIRRPSMVENVTVKRRTGRRPDSDSSGGGGGRGRTHSGRR